MNRMTDMRTIEAANYFKGEVLEIMPDIPVDELSTMVGEYLYYQQVDVSRGLALEVVEETCIKK